MYVTLTPHTAAFLEALVKKSSEGYCTGMWFYSTAACTSADVHVDMAKCSHPQPNRGPCSY